MIMLAVAADPAVCNPHSECLLQPERHQRLRRNVDASALGQDLGTGARSGATCTANRRTLAAAGNGANDRTDRRSAAYELTCALLGAQTVRLSRSDGNILRLNPVALPVCPNGLLIQRNLI